MLRSRLGKHERTDTGRQVVPYRHHPHLTAGGHRTKVWGEQRLPVHGVAQPLYLLLEPPEVSAVVQALEVRDLLEHQHLVLRRRLLDQPQLIEHQPALGPDAPVPVTVDRIVLARTTRQVNLCRPQTPRCDRSQPLQWRYSHVALEDLPCRLLAIECSHAFATRLHHAQGTTPHAAERVVERKVPYRPCVASHLHRSQPFPATVHLIAVPALTRTLAQSLPHYIPARVTRYPHACDVRPWI